ncbi:MAG: LacI family DNA-binding transcriptional regulator [Propionibacteriaceae bacterium]|nr:LacI family DNA-binding transcriptional regulator [Micropruina sp.]HBX82363.1 LacI family transcriptional regulator [Propionibacteriaceae bacterium]HBY22539.1 LacI family transcriptional regulator [Propionibacteriaceae bacterium]
MNRRSMVGLTDVARAAGVSRSTASRALRGEDRVSEETRTYVADIAASLGYVRDRRAADLASNSPTAVGLVVRSAERSFYGEIASRVQDKIDDLGMDLLMANGGDDHPAQMKALDSLIGRHLAGLIIASGRASLPAAEHAATFLPVVLVGFGSVSAAGIDTVSIDRASESIMVQAVLGEGHRHVAVTTAPADASLTLYERWTSFETFLQAGGATVVLIPHEGIGDQGIFAQALREAIEDGVTAVMCGEDPTAVQVLELLHEWGIACPGEVSVTGFDGSGTFSSPLIGLTTFQQPVRQMAKDAVDLLMARVGGLQGPAEHRVHEGELLRGRTLGPVARADDESA